VRGAQRFHPVGSVATCQRDFDCEKGSDDRYIAASFFLSSLVAVSLSACSVNWWILDGDIEHGE
jgi:hypothetical protein